MTSIWGGHGGLYGAPYGWAREWPVESGGVTLAVADATHGHAADNLDLTQAHTLAVQESAHSHAADNLDLVQLYTLTIAESSHGHAADNLDLTQAHTLAVQESLIRASRVVMPWLMTRVRLMVSAWSIRKS